MAQHQVDQFKTGIWSVNNLLLSLDQLSIPDYQRPYKWTEKNLNALVNDIQEHKDKSAYRLGTIVLHHDKNNTSLKNINIVDGQQRTLTLILLVWAVIQKQQLDLKQEHLKKDLNEISNQINVFMDVQKFNSDISHYNIYQNFNAAKRIVSVNFSEQDIDFLLNNCQVAVFILDDKDYSGLSDRKQGNVFRAAIGNLVNTFYIDNVYKPESETAQLLCKIYHAYHKLAKKHPPEEILAKLKDIYPSPFALIS